MVSTDLHSVQKLFSGKVRDVYAIDAQRLMLVATDRLSAFDVVFAEGVPDKGKLLTAMASFWFHWLSQNIPDLHHHLLSTPPESLVADDEQAIVRHRSVVVRKTRPLPIEAVVRGYLAGSGWRDYQQSGAVCGIALAQGLAQSARLSEAIFTPARKAPQGAHDENITFAQMTELVGETLAEQVREQSLQLYRVAHEYALSRGLIIADTKFEWGLDEEDRLTLIDEVLTMDSSRYWAKDEYREGISPPSFDKQFVRDYLVDLGWNQQPPPPHLPDSIVLALARKYQQALALLTR